MHRWPKLVLIAILTGIISLAGCSTLMLGGNRAPNRQVLPAGIEVTSGSLASSTGCVLAYRLYRPSVSRDSDHEKALVILGHGFLRSKDRMSGLAEAVAVAGTPVATIDFCNMSLWNGRHQQNGLDMIALANRLGPGLGARRVIYSGFSAGALAAVVAARNDPRALGAVALDLVDAQGIGVRAASQLDKPLIGIMGEPTNCNARGSGTAVFAASPNATVQRIAGAGHCDFEAPTDALCELLCDDPDGTAAITPLTSNDSTRRHIIASAGVAITALASY